MTTVLFLSGATMVVLGVRGWMNVTQTTTDERMLRNVAAIVAAHDYQVKLRNRTSGGSEPDGQEANSGACPGGVETGTPRTPTSPSSAGTATTPPRSAVPATPAPAGTDAAPPRPYPPCVRRAPTSAAAWRGAAEEVDDHPASTPSPAGAGRSLPHKVPAPAGPQRVRVMFDG